MENTNEDGPRIVGTYDKKNKTLSNIYQISKLAREGVHFYEEQLRRELVFRMDFKDLYKCTVKKDSHVPVHLRSIHKACCGYVVAKAYKYEVNLVPVYQGKINKFTIGMGGYDDRTMIANCIICIVKNHDDYSDYLNHTENTKPMIHKLFEPIEL